MNKMKNSRFMDRIFLIESLDKSIAAFAQGCLAVFTAGATGILDVSAIEIFSVATLSMAVSVAYSFSTRLATSNEELIEEAKITEIVKKHYEGELQ